MDKNRSLYLLCFVVMYTGQKYSRRQLARSCCFSSFQLTAALDTLCLLTDEAVLQESSAQPDTAALKSGGFSA